MTLPTTPSFRLTGKRALVVGASSGIGLGCAVALAEAGADLVLAARTESKLKAVQEAFTDQGWSSETLMIDSSDVDQASILIRENGPFDIAVYSAGVARHTPAIETTSEDFDSVIEINLRGAYFFAQAVARGLLRAEKPGSIIFISSQMAHVGGFDRAVYSGSKHAIEGLQKSMAIEWGPAGIRVNSICPTFIRTPLTEQTFDRPERVRWIEEKIKLGRVGEVEDIMGAVLFLASSASSLVTGTSILIDGGWTAG